MAFLSNATLDVANPAFIIETTPDPVDIGPYRKIRLKLNKKGVWSVWWTEARSDGDYEPKRESCHTTVLAQAESYLDAFCRNVRQNAAAVATPAVYSVEALCARRLAILMSSGKDKTAGYSLTAVRRFFGSLTADQIDAVRLQDYRAQRKVADSTVRRELTELRTTLNWAVGQKLIAADDVPLFNEDVMPPEGAARQLFLTEDQARLAWDKALAVGAAGNDVGYRVMLYVCLGLETAARNSALMDLSWGRVNMQLGLIDYRNPLKRATKKVRVEVAMSKRLRPVIEAARGQAIAEGRVDRNGQPTGQVVWGVKSVKKPFKNFFKEIGLGWVTAHTMRHTWCSLRAMRGMRLEDIATFVGDNYDTIKKHYIHLTPGHMHDIANFGQKD